MNTDEIKVENQDLAWLLYQKDLTIVILQKKLAATMGFCTEILKRLETYEGKTSVGSGGTDVQAEGNQAG